MQHTSGLQGGAGGPNGNFLDKPLLTLHISFKPGSEVRLVGPTVAVHICGRAGKQEMEQLDPNQVEWRLPERHLRLFAVCPLCSEQILSPIVSAVLFSLKD